MAARSPGRTAPALQTGRRHCHATRPSKELHQDSCSLGGLKRPLEDGVEPSKRAGTNMEHLATLEPVLGGPSLGLESGDAFAKSGDRLVLDDGETISDGQQ